MIMPMNVSFVVMAAIVVVFVTVRVLVPAFMPLAVIIGDAVRLSLLRIIVVSFHRILSGGIGNVRFIMRDHSDARGFFRRIRNQPFITSMGSGSPAAKTVR